ncbi:hypothetical protein [Trinickia sp. EG282A]|uniref:hypothetical protein n=1 Tax=Trinickia sp. EG282A TaxID=3237013 RepID=UPI0034D3840C
MAQKKKMQSAADFCKSAAKEPSTIRSSICRRYRLGNVGTDIDVNVTSRGIMEQLDKFKNVVDTFKKQEFALQKQAREYEALQREIAVLRERAAFDADARRKLERLDEVMRSGGQQLQNQVREKTRRLQSVINGIADKFVELLPKDGGRAVESKPSPKCATAKKAARKFV